jgi:hypothetical protein
MNVRENWGYLLACYNYTIGRYGGRGLGLKWKGSDVGLRVGVRGDGGGGGRHSNDASLTPGANCGALLLSSRNQNTRRVPP